MRQRARPRPIPPDSGLHFSATVGDRETWWRIPFPIYIAPLIKAHATAISAPTDEIEMTVDVALVVAAALGRCWADPDTELQTPPSRDVVAYGEAVAEELYEAGWSLADVMEAGAAVMGRLADVARISSREVEARMGFTRAQREAVS